ncbi:unnamed protein product [Rotaria socialis]|uniref:Poly [ADP-ribose] polymerase n=1 Tax=Rotaria socialis TaxID=392032 RepID=A0A817UD79_9BILA|nr:unnamed protein product [Rotaria socialis]
MSSLPFKCDDDGIPQPTPNSKSQSSPIIVCHGDLITREADVIVVCSSSEYLFESICQAGGDPVSASYKQQNSRNPNAPIIIVESAGKIASKTIYFLPWKANPDESILRKSIENFVSLALEKAIEQKYRSIVFPAIGCGGFGCSIQLIGRTMIETVYSKLKTYQMSVSFVIQPNKKHIYDEFKEHVDALKLPSASSIELRKIAADFGKGVIEVEMGDITTQTVDVIVGSTSSGILREIILKAAVNTNQENVYGEFCKQVLKTEDGFYQRPCYQLPATWEKSAEDKIRFTLSTKMHEYKSIASNFDQTMKGKYTDIIKIERIQNERGYLQYLVHSKDFLKRLKVDTEKRLYHGCPEQAANAIIVEGFNRSYAGEHGTLYGFGVYFSSDAAYSHGYTKSNANDERCMFLARVLIGETTQGNHKMKTRPPGFDSTTDGNHIFVTYHDAQALAEYLITYK